MKSFRFRKKIHVINFGISKYDEHTLLSQLLVDEPLLHEANWIEQASYCN